MHSFLSVALVTLVIALGACGKRDIAPQSISKPSDTVTSPEPSVNAPIVVAVTEPRCDYGSYVPPESSATGGTGGGTGPNAGNGNVSAIHWKGQTLHVEGYPQQDVERLVCGSYISFARCFDASATTTTDLDGTIGMTITLDADGRVDAKTIGGSLDQPKLATCMIDAAKTLRFEKTDKPATVSYAFSVHRSAKLKVITMSESGVAIVGGLAPEVIKGTVRAAFPRLRACYEPELAKEPKLKGIVSTKVVIGATGAIESVKPLGGSMPSAAVRDCVTKVFTTLAFPQPEGGKVTVTYPIYFAPEEE